MAHTQVASIVLAAASATAVCASQTPSAGALTINGSAASGGVATLSPARRVLVTTTGNESSKTMTITGTDRGGNPMTETVSLPNTGTVYTNQDFLKVTAVTISAGAAAALTVGTNGVASTRWVMLDMLMPVFNVSAGVNFLNSTAVVQLEGCLDSFQKSLYDANPINGGDASAAGLATDTFVAPIPFPIGSTFTQDQIVPITFPIRAVRLTVNSGATTAGTRLTVLQQGI